MGINNLKIVIITILSCIIITLTAIIAFAANKQQTSQTIKKSENSMTENFPQYIESIAQKNFKSSQIFNDEKPILSAEKLKELEGNINKEYGIREDILRLIEKEIPPLNETAKYAAIRYTQSLNFIYYHANQQEALNEASKHLIILECLSKIIPDQYINITRKIDDSMRNTQERDDHHWMIDKNYFGWKVIGNGGLSSKKIDEICENRRY